MAVDHSTPVSVVVATVAGAAAVFDALGIDYSSPGERTVAEAAGLEGVDSVAVVRQLQGLPANREPTWLDRSLTELTQFLISQHHRFIREELARAAEDLADLCSGSAAADEALQSLRETFKGLSGELLPHIHREEDELFPMIERLEAVWQSAEREPHVPPDGIAAQIRHLLLEHGSIAAQVRRLRELRLTLESHDLMPRCRGVLLGIARIEAHLREYMFLENCILFPRALAMERSL